MGRMAASIALLAALAWIVEADQGRWLAEKANADRGDSPRLRPFRPTTRAAQKGPTRDPMAKTTRRFWLL